MRNRLLKRTLVALAVANLAPLAVLVLSFFPPLLQRLTRHGTVTLSVVRAACALALATIAALIWQRDRIEALLETAHAHVRRVVAEQGLTPPSVKAPAVHLMLLAVAVLAAAVAISLATITPAGYRAFIREDGIVEWASSLSWFAAAACATIALCVDRRQLGRKTAVYGPLIAFFVFCGGEEISWGQRLLAFQTPVGLFDFNKQHELNLHDIGSIAVYANVFFAFTLICCLVVPLLLKRAPEWQAYLRDRNAPIIDPFVARVCIVGLVAWLYVGIRFGTLGFSPLSIWGYYSQMDDEIFEFFAAYGFLALAALDLTHRLTSVGHTAPVARLRAA